MTTPPARLSETVFRSFEDVITRAVATFPHAILMPTATPNSLACRLRSAMKSFAEYQWSPTTVDKDKFLKLYTSGLVVRERDGEVVIGSRVTTKFLSAPQSCSFIEQDPGASPDTEVVIDLSHNLQVPNVLAALASERALSKRIRLIGLSQLQACELNQNYDILLEEVVGKTNEHLLT